MNQKVDDSSFKINKSPMTDIYTFFTVINCHLHAYTDRGAGHDCSSSLRSVRDSYSLSVIIEIIIKLVFYGFNNYML